MEEFTPLGAEMARLAGRLGTLAPAVCDEGQLEWIVASGRRLEAFAAAQVALATVQLERLLRESHAEGLRDRTGEPADADAASGPRADDASAGTSDAASGADDATASADGAASAGGDEASAGGDTNAPGNGGPSAAGETSTGGGDTAGTVDSADDSRGGPGEPGGRRESAEELARQIRRGKWLRRCELFAAALQAGTISAEHIDALAVVLEHVEPHVRADVLADEERLVEVARRMARTGFARYLRDVIDRVRADGGMSRFERQLKNSFASFKADDDTQMYRLFCEIDPVRGAEMFQAVQRRVDEMYQTKGATDGLSRNQVVLAALHGLICREPTTAVDGDSDDDVGGGPELIVICDCQSLVSGAHAHTICETYDGIRLPVSLVRDMCAEAMLTVAIAGADGQILKIGMAERLANRAQRRALRAKYRHCAHPECTVPFAACRIHHVVPWEKKGPTDIGNLLPLCFKHHHLVHEGGWRLTIDPDRTLHWYRPGGALYATTPFVPLLTPTTQRSAAARGSPSGATSGPSPPAGSDPPAAAPSAAAAEELRLFDPPAA